MSEIEFDQDSPHEPLPKEVRQTIPVPPQQPGATISTSAEPIAEPTPGNFSQPAYDESGDEDVEFVPGEDDGPAAAAQEKAEEEPVDVIDVLEPKSAPREWSFGPEGAEITFVQRPLGFLQKMKWFALIGEALDAAMSGPGGLSVADLPVGGPGGNRAAGIRNIANVRDADTFVRAISKVIHRAPDFLADSYCIWLGVPDIQRDLVKEIMAAPEEEGGLTDEQGLEMIEVFIDQNYEALADFFGGRVATLAERVAQRQKEREEKKAGRVRA